jgi:hypothetical protein
MWVASVGSAAKKPGRKGSVKLVRNATADYDHQLREAERNRSLRKWIKGHYWQMRGHDPVFTDHTFKGNPRWSPPPMTGCGGGTAAPQTQTVTVNAGTTYTAQFKKR